ncbi:membrane-bound transcriptional regulator, ribonuclease BN-related [Geotalea daltonii FRC-32]|uniref:Membrane-bound transcriptional regulator, ribonuclease BN-related n=1 Tax=Geotalea daltonii (strain DSM 22248 / JCM 15807 / FRC-32) TaxID=316067 RepID=B9M1B9_GEODF|nr:YihY/virulence factor BrkB family protein [Geotalea daltonii]ACM19189.1 membrane-bound transcriptional regulator, ribonuclease BN-related [Geotalea daltonii FRC-32]
MKNAADIISFFTKDLWNLNPDAYGGIKRYWVKYLQIMALVIKNFWDDNCLLRASALSFTTILSIVPFFALTFAVLKGFDVQNKVEPYILEQVTAGSEELVDKIVTYINNTNMTSMGTIGLATLVVTAITLLGNIEEAFNVIWGVKGTRSLQRKFSDYLSVLLSGPLLMLAAISVTTTLQSQSVVRWLLQTSYLGDVLLFSFRLIPYISVWLALFFLYILIPNTRVKAKSALIGGVLAGTVWQAAQWGYLYFQVGVGKYNAIYGTLALLPIFMVWIYTSWVIVLFGVEVVAAHQNIKTFRHEFRTQQISPAMMDLLALSILQEVATAFHLGSPPLTKERLAESLDVPIRLVRELLIQLTDSGYLIRSAGELSSYYPARELEQIPVNEVLSSLRGYGDRDWIEKVARQEELSHEILIRANNAADAALAGLTMKDLISTRKIS